MAVRGTSIRIFLAEGSPDGLWVVEKSNWTGIGLVASRSGYPVLRDRPEIQGPGVYVLVGPADGVARTYRIYIGETDVLRPRLDSHLKNKEFWTRVIVFTSKDANLNKAHVRYLESRLINLAQEAKRVEVENSTVSSMPSLSEADKADMEAFLEDMLLLYPVVGITAFESSGVSAATAGLRLRLVGKDALAAGYESGDEFVVLAGSLARTETVASMPDYALKLRADLQADGILYSEGPHLRFVQDYVFTSPSRAAMTILGRTANGRVEWKLEDGRTLKELQESTLE